MNDNVTNILSLVSDHKSENLGLEILWGGPKKNYTTKANYQKIHNTIKKNKRGIKNQQVDLQDVT